MRTADIQVSTSKLDGFSPAAEVAAAYVQVGSKLLVLQRNGSESGCWGVPAGKLERDESPEVAMRRELHEETDICLSEKEPLTYLGTLYVRKPHIDYLYHMFQLVLDHEPGITLSSEHQSFGWYEPRELDALPLMAGAREVLDHFRALPSSLGSMAMVNAYLILRKGRGVLLHLRRNTGYLDGHYGLVSGHVEGLESAKDGLVREAFEEAGIRIAKEDLSFVHCLHRKSDRLNVDLFFSCDRWEGEVQNREPYRCAGLEFFPVDSLPETTAGYIRKVLGHMEGGEFYSEEGWRR